MEHLIVGKLNTTAGAHSLVKWGQIGKKISTFQPKYSTFVGCNCNLKYLATSCTYGTHIKSETNLRQMKLNCTTTGLCQQLLTCC